ncbi:hypothetical protein [Streptomyces sp. NPDC005780]|uniref:hypothetical protein n=1 Tax=Streptomyces sp. NPDC005780 TaxID=3364730 RepID=UPI0036BBE497
MPDTALVADTDCCANTDFGPAPVEELIENTTTDTRAERHSQRLSETVQSLPLTGRSNCSVARELRLNHRTVSAGTDSSSRPGT